jgi:ribose 5-phosphate isomerase RpiB
MFFTARQLEALHRESGSNGQLVLPYRARLTPAAQDWVRLKKVALGYSEEGAAAVRGRSQNAGSGTAPTTGLKNGNGPSPAKRADGAGATADTMLWWCDGPCGVAKAAITQQERESLLRGIDLPSDANQLVPVVKRLASEIKAGSAAAGVLVVKNASAAMVFANRCPSLRAVVGTCLDAVEQAISQMAANVLVIEHPYKTLSQVKSMLARFARAKRELSPDVQRQLAELSSCG